jgi:hypothetical protein
MGWLVRRQPVSERGEKKGPMIHSGGSKKVGSWASDPETRSGNNNNKKRRWKSKKRGTPKDTGEAEIGKVCRGECCFLATFSTFFIRKQKFDNSIIVFNVRRTIDQGALNNKE